ncbi:poly-gamma-glutamate synthesis protein (capsule biosynthesis protein) [Herbihabitans rhizosphaerae]|uniref:Poly-gamma-glutamate synthesis protein (Capsule biosynthesis protein) n=1 Tax=Herbihabitans rhizosphaerae TaxID=1872711 RepID=A0A4Q7KWN3_9PSEU|nr:CapA family protein [Herbihabitans rhizosphaerae]RZS41077.1 poly-gamma-glutamate synthesis protein (capsule biosynthesis protein) [Herbihabitans rhizosphaerae]
MTRAKIRVSVLLAACAIAATSCSGEEPSGVTVPSVGRSTTMGKPAPTTAPRGQAFTVAATGDVLIHPALTDQATTDGGGRRDYRPLLAGVKPAIESADLAVCHLEVPLASANGPFDGYPAFNAPPEIARALKDTGYDTCSTASNHTLDKGADGVARTLSTLDEAGIEHTGSARSKAEASKPLVREVNGVKVGQVSFTFGFNGIKLPPDKPWLSNTLDADAVIAAAKATRKAGAEVVIASLHWGTEFVHEPTADQRDTARRVLADPNVDLIIGHHAHVVQPIEKIGDKWVAYGLGNHIAKHSEPRGTTEEGLIGLFRFSRTASGWTVDNAQYVPTLVDLGPPIRLRDLSAATGVEPARREQALTRIDRIVLSRGASRSGLSRR